MLANDPQLLILDEAYKPPKIYLVSKSLVALDKYSGAVLYVSR